MEREDRSVDAATLAASARYGHEVVARIVALCEAEPERESCGFVIARGDVREVVPIPNVADRYHAADPRAHPRTSRDGFVMDPRALVGTYRSLDSSGGRVLAVWHSHVDGSAAFSEQDRTDALAGGTPVLPGAEYLVAGMRRGRVTDLRAFRFDGSGYVDAVVSIGDRNAD